LKESSLVCTKVFKGMQLAEITILNVEGNHSSGGSVGDLLRREGFDVVDAATGAEALKLVKTVHPRLLTLAVGLPDISGYEVCQRLKSDPGTARIPVLQVSSAFGSGEDRVRGLESGADACLVRPFESEELMATIKALLRLGEAEEARRETEARYQLLFEGNSLPTWIFDLQTFEFLAVNEAAVHHYGYARDEYRSMTIRDLHSSDDSPAIEDFLGGGPSAIPNAAQWKHRKKDATVIDVEIVWHELIFRGRHALLVLAKDVTERRQAREAIRESEARFRMMADTAPVMIWISGDDKLGAFFNKHWLDFTGRTMEQEMDYGWAESVHPDDCERCLSTYASHFDAREPFSMEYRHRRNDGEYRWLLNEGVPRFSPNGNFQGYIGCCIDITERKGAEAEREELLAKEKRAREEAQNANRAKDEFLALVSHELRAPLNAMLGWARILRSTRVDQATMTHAIEIIERSARNQSKLVEDLLDTARIATGKLRLDIQPVDLSVVVSTAVEILKPASVAKGIEIRLALDAPREVIAGDPDRLQQIVWNLLSNAIKFTPHGGRVEVHLERADPHVRITVRDSGKGIRAEFVPYLFESFYQADSSSTRRHGGLGLGLSLVRHLVELHGGTVSAESAGEGEGSAFIVNLPLRAVRPHAAGDEGSEPSDSVGSLRSSLNGLWVLVVDDEPDARELITLLLRQYGAEVTSVASVREAMEVLTAGREAGRPDVLVADISMPGEDGYSLIRRVRELAPELGGQMPAVAVTAFGRSVDRIRALAAGFQLHIPKPVDPVELATVIGSLTGRSVKGMRA
jgi:PAS domain S-box-containing protein